MIYTNILSVKQLDIFKKIKSLPENSYLAGGTALALQLGHRTSLDFDFYTQGHFDTEIVSKQLRKDLGDIKIGRVAKDTLTFDASGVSISLFYYPYELIGTPITFEEKKLASVEDIGAMKMIAISMRGTRRDFVDAYYLLQKFSLVQMIKFTLKKYPAYQEMVILKGLIYFKDAEDEDLSRGIEIFDKNFSWAQAKEKIFREVEKYQSGLI